MANRGLNRRDRRTLITVLGTLLWIAIGNAALQLPVGIVYGLVLVVAPLIWLLTGLGAQQTTTSEKRRD